MENDGYAWQEDEYISLINLHGTESTVPQIYPSISLALRTQRDRNLVCSRALQNAMLFLYIGIKSGWIPMVELN